jgi:hypothetical protein
MKKLVKAGIVGTAIMGAALASATSLNALNNTNDGGAIQSGASPVAACQPDVQALHVDYQMGGTFPDYLKAVQVSGFDDACDGKIARVYIINSNGDVIQSSADQIKPYNNAVTIGGWTVAATDVDHIGVTVADVDSFGSFPVAP